MRSIGTKAEVVFPLFKNLKMTAKVDTGAYSGSLFCTEAYVTESEGVYKLVFRPYGSKETYEATNYRVITVKSSNGAREQRFSIVTEILLNGEAFNMRITLANREGMKYPMLIGRRFLRAQKFVVDPSGVLKNWTPDDSNN